MKKMASCWCLTFVFMKHKFPGGIIFSESSLCQEQRQFSLSDNFSDYNKILITMKKDAAQP